MCGVLVIIHLILGRLFSTRCIHKVYPKSGVRDTKVKYLILGVFSRKGYNPIISLCYDIYYCVSGR